MFDPWVGKIPWRREWLPTPVFLPGGFHGQNSLAGYSPQGQKELDSTEMTEHAHTRVNNIFSLNISKIPNCLYGQVKTRK